MHHDPACYETHTLQALAPLIRARYATLSPEELALRRAFLTRYLALCEAQGWKACQARAQWWLEMLEDIED